MRNKKQAFTHSHSATVDPSHDQAMCLRWTRDTAPLAHLPSPSAHPVLTVTPNLVKHAIKKNKTMTLPHNNATRVTHSSISSSSLAL